MAHPRYLDTFLKSWPGILLCASIGAFSLLLSAHVSNLSPMLVAILAGVIARNLMPVPKGLEPGIAFSAKTILRWGVVLLGLQISVSQIASLGLGVLAIVLVAVGLTFTVTLLAGRLLKVDSELTMLIASGFSICGAAAVAGMQGTLRAKGEKVAAAVALVVLFGTLMIAIGPLIASAMGWQGTPAGVFIGASTHEVAQVVAGAGITGDSLHVGDAVLEAAVPVKLARVALLAPVIIAAGWLHSRGLRSAGGQAREGGKKPPILPLFVVGFLLMIVVASVNVVPSNALDTVKHIQQFLLADAMFALGLGVHIKSLIALGARPLILGLLSTCTIIAIALVGVLIVF